jgi:hypothetical protein
MLQPEGLGGDAPCKCPLKFEQRRMSERDPPEQKIPAAPNGQESRPAMAGHVRPDSSLVQRVIQIFPPNATRGRQHRMSTAARAGRPCAAMGRIADPPSPAASATRDRGQSPALAAAPCKALAEPWVPGRPPPTHRGGYLVSIMTLLLLSSLK